MSVLYNNINIIIIIVIVMIFKVFPLQNTVVMESGQQAQQPVATFKVNFNTCEGCGTI